MKVHKFPITLTEQLTKTKTVLVDLLAFQILNFSCSLQLQISNGRNPVGQFASFLGLENIKEYVIKITQTEETPGKISVIAEVRVQEGFNL